MNFALDPDSQQWPVPHTQNSRPTEQTHSLHRDTAIKQADTCDDTLGTFAIETHELQPELKQTSSSSSEVITAPSRSYATCDSTMFADSVLR